TVGGGQHADGGADPAALKGDGGAGAMCPLEPHGVGRPVFHAEAARDGDGSVAVSRDDRVAADEYLDGAVGRLTGGAAGEGRDGRGEGAALVEQLVDGAASGEGRADAGVEVG